MFRHTLTAASLFPKQTLFSQAKKHKFIFLVVWCCSTGRPGNLILKEADLRKIIMHSHVTLLIFTNFNESKN